MSGSYQRMRTVYSAFFLNSPPLTVVKYFVIVYLKTVLEADLGGTEIYDPLAWIFEQPTINGYSRQVFVLTDGEVCVFGIIINPLKQMSNTIIAFRFRMLIRSFL